MSQNLQREIFPVLFAVVFSVMLTKAADNDAFVGGMSYPDLVKVGFSVIVIIILPMLYFVTAFRRIVARDIHWNTWRVLETVIYIGPVDGFYSLWLLLVQAWGWGNKSISEGDWRVWVLRVIAAGVIPYTILLVATRSKETADPKRAEPGAM